MAFSLVALWHPLLLLLAFLLPLPLLLLLSAKNPQACNDGRAPLPPSPRGLPLLGHLPLLGTLPHRALRTLAAAHGPVMLLRLGRVPAVVVSSAAAAEEVMRTRDSAFASRPRVLMAERLFYGSRDVAFAPYGKYWRQARRVCVLHLLSARRIHSFRRVREQEARAMLAKVAAAAAAGGGRAVNLSELLISYTNTVVCRAAFGRAYGFGGDGKMMKNVFVDFEELLGTTPVAEFLPWLGWLDRVTGLEKKVRATSRAMDDILEEVIEDHRRRQCENDGEEEEEGGDASDHRDFVDVLLGVNKIDKEAGIRLDTREIKAIILDMFATGTDTTYTTIEWAMAELMNHPQQLKKAQAEVRRVVATATAAVDGGHVTEDHLEAMTYLAQLTKAYGSGTKTRPDLRRTNIPFTSLMSTAPDASSQSKLYNRLASMSSAATMANPTPEHPRRPAPKGTSPKSCPRKSTALPTNHSGQNSSALSGHAALYCPTAKVLTTTLVRAGTR